MKTQFLQQIYKLDNEIINQKYKHLKCLLILEVVGIGYTLAVNSSMEIVLATISILNNLIHFSAQERIRLSSMAHHL